MPNGGGGLGGLGNALAGVKLKKAAPIVKPVDKTEAVIASLEKAPTFTPALQRTEDEWKTVLTPEEYAIIRGKGTEMAGSGEYDKFCPAASEGHFVCRACKQPLYSAAAKFESGCGWPAFDKCYVGAVRMSLDESHGLKRVEITCKNCDGHLGHVFLGERKTDTDERHCVNSMSIKFVKGAPAETLKEEALAVP